MLQPTAQSANDKFSGDDFANCFVDKVATICAATAAAATPVIIPGEVVPPVTELELTCISEMSQLLSTLPAKSCTLTPSLPETI